MSGISIGELVGTISLNDQFSGPIDKVAKALGVSSQSLSAVAGFAGIAAGAVTSAAGAIAFLGARGAVVNDVRDAFGDLSGRVHETANAMLGELQKGTAGTISNFDLMQMANKALGSGLVTSAKDMGTLAAGAKLLADRTGGDTAEAFDTLTTAMAKGKTATLKQFGVFVDAKGAVEEYARSIHKNASDLTEHEKATALSQATVAALNRELKAAGPPTMDFGDLIDRAKTGVSNFVDNLGAAVAASPVVMAGLKGIEDALGNAFGSDQQGTVKMLMGYVNQFAIFLVDAAGVGVEFARVLTNAFTGSKVLFNAFLEALATGLDAAVGGLAALAQKATEIPGIGDKFKGLADGLQTAKDFTSSLALGFQDLKEQALDSAADQNAAFDTVSGALNKLGNDMREAAKAEVDLSTGADGVKRGLDTVTDAASLTEAQLKAIEDATRKGEEALFDLATNGAAKVQELQDQMTLATLTGSEARQFEIQLEYEKELASLQGYALEQPAIYQELVDLVTAKYQQMSEAANGYYATAGAYAEAFGFVSRDQMEQNVATTLQGYMDMLASGQFTAKELKKAWEAYIKAKDDLDGKTTLSTIQKFELIASSASTILKSIFGKNKAAAIAAAVIDTAAAVVKTLAAYPWPWSLIPAAAAAAAGYAQIRQIESADASFATGTPETAFMNFGRGTAAMLHGREAVVNQAQGDTLQDMLVGAVKERDDRVAKQLERMEAAQDRRDRALPLWLRDAVMLTGA